MTHELFLNIMQSLMVHNAARAGNVASGGGPAGPPQQRSSLKLSRAASSNLSTSDEPQPLLSRSAESLHGASAAVRRAKQEVRSQPAGRTLVNVACGCVRLVSK